MNWKKIGIALLTIDFVALTAYTLFAEPLSAGIEAVSGSFWGMQIGIDLCIALSIGTVLMWRDARRLGINPLPYALAVLPTGSIALLVYALRRPSESSAPAASALAASAA